MIGRGGASGSGGGREEGRGPLPGGPETVEGQVRASDPEVRDVRRRRRFTTGYKLRVLEEADRCDQGQLGALLRREGLYRSNLTTWRRQRETGELTAGRRKHSAAEREVRRELARTKRENERLRQRLAQAETIIGVQKKTPMAADAAANDNENRGEGGWCGSRETGREGGGRRGIASCGG